MTTPITPDELLALADRADAAGQTWASCLLRFVAAAMEEGDDATGSLASRCYHWAQRRMTQIRVRIAELN